MYEAGDAFRASSALCPLLLCWAFLLYPTLLHPTLPTVGTQRACRQQWGCGSRRTWRQWSSSMGMQVVHLECLVTVCLFPLPFRC